MSAELVVFFISAVVAVCGALMMIVQRNPVASVLYLILSLVAQAVCYIQLGGLFLGAILVIVYAGAIMVLFLFVIMLLNLRGGEELGKPMNAISLFTKFTIPTLMLVELLFVIKESFASMTGSNGADALSDGFGSVAEVAKLMFTRYLYPFELTGVLLLIAIVGAVVLAKSEDSQPTAEGEN